MMTSGSTPNGIIYPLTLLGLSLPFLAVGLLLTIKRLRDADLSPWLSLLFFVPLVKFILFIILVLHAREPRQSAPASALPPPIPKKFGRRLLKEMVMAAVVSASCAVPLILAAIYVFGSYGWALFVLIPFFQGFFSTLIVMRGAYSDYAHCLLAALLSMFLAGMALFVLAIEGLICLLMAAPLAVALGFMGASFAYLIKTRLFSSQAYHRMNLSILGVIPICLWLDHISAPEPTVLPVSTAIMIEASPEKVWQHVVSFSRLPEKRDWIFHTGIAYPIEAVIDGEGPGAVRLCRFSTGDFVEPITVWSPPHRLEFDVIQCPCPMEEWTPYKHVHPPHLHGFLVSTKGRFLIEKNSDGKVLLTGTTWYRHSLWPEAYWTLWSDFIIHKIHLRVLRHIKYLAEKSHP